MGPSSLLVIEDHTRNDRKHALKREEQRRLSRRHNGLPHVLDERCHTGRENHQVGKGKPERGAKPGQLRRLLAQGQREHGTGQRHEAQLHHRDGSHVVRAGEPVDKHNLEGKEHRREKREPLASPQRRTHVVPQRDERDSHNAQERRHQARRARTPADHHPVDERHQHTIDGSEKGASPRRRVGKTEVLDGKPRAIQHAQDSSRKDVAPIKVVAQALPEDRRHEHRGH